MVSCRRKRTSGWIPVFLCILMLSGCSASNPVSTEKYAGNRKDTGNSTVKIAYYGKIYEAPLFAAFEKDFFENHGIQVELVAIADGSIKSEFNAGKVDAVTADYRFFQYIEEELPMKLTAGLHAGCIRVIVPSGSGIADIRDLKGTRIGVEAPGDGTMVLASMLLKSNGIDTEKGLPWRYYGENGWMQAFENGDIDAACIWEPSETDSQLLNDGYRTIYTSAQAKHTGGSGGGHAHGDGLHFTRTFTGLSTDLVEGNAEKAVFITRAWLEGARWVSENTEEAARLVTDKRYVNGSDEENRNRLSSYMWTNGVRTAKPNIRYYIKEQKVNGLLERAWNEDEFFNKVFAGILPEFN